MFICRFYEPWRNEVQEVRISGSVPATIGLTMSGRTVDSPVSTTDVAGWSDELVKLTQPKCQYQTHLPLDTIAKFQVNVLF